MRKFILITAIGLVSLGTVWMIDATNQQSKVKLLIAKAGGLKVLLSSVKHDPSSISSFCQSSDYRATQQNYTELLNQTDNLTKNSLSKRRISVYMIERLENFVIEVKGLAKEISSQCGSAEQIWGIWGTSIY